MGVDLIINNTIYDGVESISIPKTDGALANFVLKSYTNKVPISINADGTIYNDVGYKEGYRIRSGGAEGAQADGVCTGYIPFKAGDTLKIYPALGVDYPTTACINFSDGSFTNLGQSNQNNNAGTQYGICSGNAQYFVPTIVDGASVLTLDPNAPNASEIQYVRITHTLMVVSSGTDIIVTVDNGSGGGTENLNQVLTEQETIIEELKTILQGKASGGATNNNYEKFIAKPTSTSVFAFDNPLGVTDVTIKVKRIGVYEGSSRKITKYVADGELGIGVMECVSSSDVVRYSSKIDNASVGNGEFAITSETIRLYQYSAANTWDTSAEYGILLFQTRRLDND